MAVLVPTVLCAIPLVVVLVLAASIRSCQFGEPKRQACAGSGSRLVRATASKGPAAVDRLLDEGADPNRPDAVGNRALACAAMLGNTGAVDRLLAGGADPNAAGHTGGRPAVAAISGEGNGLFTSAPPSGSGAPDEPYFASLGSGTRIAIVRALLAAGADGAPALSPAVVADNRGAIDTLLAAGVDPDGPPAEPGPLMVAAYFGNEPLVALLLDRGADPDHGGQIDGETLSLAVTLPDGAGAFFDHFTPPPSGPGTTTPQTLPASLPCQGEVPPLVAAAYTGRTSIAQRLIGAGADPDRLAFGAIPPLYAARSHLEVARVLRAAGARVDEPVVAASPPSVPTSLPPGGFGGICAPP